jgi:hypothetical protein
MSRRSDKREKLAKQQRVKDLQWLMAAPQGRRIAAEWIESSGLGAVSAFTGNSATFYAMGRMDFVQRFVNELRAVALPDFRRMEDEALSAQSIAEQERNLPDDDSGD